MEPPPESNTQRAAVAHQRFVRRLEQRDRKIAGLERWFFLFPMAQPCIDPRGAERVKSPIESLDIAI
jgi:hypothetical protein